MAQSVLLRAAGLYTFPNRLGQIPTGALLKALNIVINRDNIIECRRGFKLYGNTMGSGSTDTAHQLLTYKGRILRHYGSGAGTTLQYDNGSGTFTSFSGTYAETTSGLRIKGLEANSNFYFTTSAGIKKISATSASTLSSASIGDAGMVKALDLKAELSTTTGFLTQESCVAYRLVWGIKDNNQNLVLGAPSERAVLYNGLNGLLIRDFNELLTNLDTSASSGGINDGNYVTTLKVGLTASAATLRTNLIALATKLDNDTIITEGAINTATTQRVSATQASIVFSADVSTFLEVGDVINFTGLGTAEMNNNRITITSVSTTTVVGTPTTNYGATDGAPVVDVGGACQRLKYTLLAQPAVLSSTPTTTELTAVQTYYSSIVSDLQTELSGITTGANYNGNTATTSGTATLTFSIPSGITTSHFYQLYRTALTTSTGTTALSSLDPGDECQLVSEENPTSAEISAGYITVNDITPDSFRGANLYTNPNTGDGILQSNDVPPLAKDIANFKNYTFYSDTQTKYRLDLTLLSVSSLTSAVSTLTIGDGTTSNTYTFVSGVAESSKVTTTTLGAVGGAGKYFNLYSANNKTAYYVWFNVDAGNTDPGVVGKTGIQVSVLSADTADQIATKIKNKLNTYDDFTVSVATNEVTITNAEVGIATDLSDNNTGFTFTVLTQGKGEDTANKKILISSLSTPAQQVDETARSIVRVINRNTSEIVYAYYLSGPTDVPGLILLESRSLGGNEFFIGHNSTTTASQFNPNLLTNIASITNISVANPTVVTSATHGLSTGDQIIISGSDSTPTIDGVRTVTVVNANTFTVDVNVTVGGTTGGWIKTINTNSGDNEVSPNRLYYSKINQPEAVPIVNYVDVGPKDKAIKRILALRDNLFILKEEGIYRLSGSVSPFTVALFDNSSPIVAPDSATVLNNLIFMLSTQGVARVSDVGVDVISRPIEDKLIKLLTPSYTNFDTATFGVSYESDRSYYLWTVTDTTDTYATQCLRFNTFTNTWVESDKTARSGIVNSSDDKLYLGAADTNYIEQERKTFDRTDFADREHSTTISQGSVNSTIITLPSVSDISAGDVIVQTQYLTINKFNQLLTKLDNDALLADSDYNSTLAMSAGMALHTQLDSLISKIAADTGRTAVIGATAGATYTALSPAPSDFSSLQTTYNSLITLLNADVGVSYSNYSSSTGTVIQETIIESVNTSISTITTEYAFPFIVGPATIYDRISCEVQWVPQYMQDSSMSKHVSEGSLIFEDFSFSTASLAFASDLSPSFEDGDFDGSDNGAYGLYGYGEPGPYGGNGSGIPFRTLVPREKQRCRYLKCKFTHAVAREMFALYGLSLTYNMVSQRAYR